MSSVPLLNPNDKIPAEIAAKFQLAKKCKPVWARLQQEDGVVETLEGKLETRAGNYLCRGINDEVWPQTEKKLLEKYEASDVFDEGGWQRFDPVSNIPPVNATPIPTPFRLKTSWGEMSGQSGDYLVQSTADPTEVWIVQREIFHASYEATESQHPSKDSQ